MTLSSGIYRISNTVTGAYYIGSAVSFERRFGEHRKQLRGGRHSNQHLQRAWAKYGEPTFRFTEVDYCEPHELIAQEQQHIDAAIALGNREQIYNISLVAGSRLGVRMSEESRRRIAESKRGKVYTAEQRKRMGDSRRGKSRSPEAVAKTAASNRGKKRSAATRALWSQQRKGKVISERHREQLSAFFKGRVFSPEHRAKAIAGIRAHHARRQERLVVEEFA